MLNIKNDMYINEELYTYNNDFDNILSYISKINKTWTNDFKQNILHILPRFDISGQGINLIKKYFSNEEIYNMLQCKTKYNMSPYYYTLEYNNLQYLRFFLEIEKNKTQLLKEKIQSEVMGCNLIDISNKIYREEEKNEWLDIVKEYITI